MEDEKIKNDLLEHSETCGERYDVDFEKELISAYMRGVRKQ